LFIEYRKIWKDYFRRRGKKYTNHWQKKIYDRIWKINIGLFPELVSRRVFLLGYFNIYSSDALFNIIIARHLSSFLSAGFHAI
jgi:hypothetical protein